MTTPPTPPFSDALLEAVKGIKSQLLLYVIAGGILVIGASVVGPDDATAVVIPLVVLLVLGLVAWTLLEARQARRPRVDQDLRFGPAARVEGGITSASVRGGGPVDDTRVRQKVRMGLFSRVSGGIHQGSIDVGGGAEPDLGDGSSSARR